MNTSNNNIKKNTWKEYFAVGEVFQYFFRVFSQKDSTSNFNLRMMHGINKISILLFLFALIVWTVKRLM